MPGIRNIYNRKFGVLVLAIMMLTSLLGPVIPKAEAASGYTLTYDSNGASSGDVSTPVTVLEDQQATVSSQSGNPLTRNGYVFAGGYYRNCSG